MEALRTRKQGLRAWESGSGLGLPKPESPGDPETRTILNGLRCKVL